jgi:methyl acetate hydrolase
VYDVFPDMQTGWSYAFLINPEAGPDGRSAGSLAWAGIANCYYWIDPVANVAGIMMTQLLPFADQSVLAAHAALERSVYGLE